MDDRTTRRIREQIRAYRKELPIYEKFAETLHACFSKECERLAPLSIVQTRPKSPESFAEKAIRKIQKYDDPVHQLTDLCGARIITMTTSEMEAMCRFVRENFRVDELNTVDVGKRMGRKEFGYRSMHYVVQLADNDLVPADVRKRIGDRKAEVQVRTVLMHGWAVISHDHLYKTSIRVPDVLERQAARLAALIEETEASFDEMVRQIDAYAEGHTAWLDSTKIAQEMEVLRCLLEIEKKEPARRGLLIRMARLARIKGESELVKRMLAPLAGDSDPEVDRLLGEALCHLHSDKPEGPQYRDGQKLLERAAGNGRDAAAHALLAESLLRQPKRLADVRANYLKAYEADSSNPYHLMAFLEFEVFIQRGAASLAQMSPSIRNALRECASHAEVGIELPRAWFTSGKLNLLLGDCDGALREWLKGIHLAMNPNGGVSKKSLLDEIESLERLRAGGKDVAAGAWWGPIALDSLEALLLMVLHFAHREPRALDRLGRFARHKFAGATHALLVVGTCDTERARDLAVYGRPLAIMLEAFDGAVVSGGTLAGLPAMVGEISRGLHSKGRRRFTLVGYHPRLLPSDVECDKRYDARVTTAAEGFTAFDTVQAWIDLVSSGLRPGSVKTLAIGGGKITLVEILLGLALGAPTAAIRESGGAASSVYEQEPWKSHPALLDLPAEGMTWRAFALQGTTSLTTEELESVGRQIHENYLKDNPAPQVDPSHQPWSNLAESLKESNRKQAAFAERILEAAGYSVRRAAKGATPSVPPFSEEEVELMSEMEHGRWMHERLAAGWRYAAKKDVDAKLSPHLVAWDKLADSVKKWDRNAVRKFPTVLADAGYEVVRNAPRRKSKS